MRKLILILTILAAASLAQAGPTLQLDGLYNTGFNDSDQLVIGDPDDNYSLTLVPSGPSDAIAIEAHTAWVDPEDYEEIEALWIGPTDAGSSDPEGDYHYELTFTIPENVNLQDLVISGRWATDNSAALSVINDTNGKTLVTKKTGYPEDDPADYAVLDEFIITDGLDHGDNTLEFIVYNGGGPGGLLVTDIQATVPAPGAFLLGGIGLSIVGYIKKRRMLN